jgi:aromatic-L-amino-acid decarboxylase
MDDESDLDKLNESILQELNRSGKIFLTQTRLNGKYVIRFVAGQTHTTAENVKNGWKFVIDSGLS